VTTIAAVTGSDAAIAPRVCCLREREGRSDHALAGGEAEVRNNFFALHSTFISLRTQSGKMTDVKNPPFIMASSLRDAVGEGTSDTIWTAFMEAYQKADDYYKDDKLDECIKQCSEILLLTGHCPRYIRILTLILLALVVESERDFRAARTEAGA
jgi:hypothetical protein